MKLNDVHLGKQRPIASQSRSSEMGQFETGELQFLMTAF